MNLDGKPFDPTRGSEGRLRYVPPRSTYSYTPPHATTRRIEPLDSHFDVHGVRWDEYYDSMTGRSYFYDATTGRTEWNIDMAVPQPPLPQRQRRQQQQQQHGDAAAGVGGGRGRGRRGGGKGKRKAQRDATSGEGSEGSGD